MADLAFFEQFQFHRRLRWNRQLPYLRMSGGQISKKVWSSFKFYFRGGRLYTRVTHAPQVIVHDRYLQDSRTSGRDPTTYVGSLFLVRYLMASVDYWKFDNSLWAKQSQPPWASLFPFLPFLKVWQLRGKVALRWCWISIFPFQSLRVL